MVIVVFWGVALLLLIFSLCFNAVIVLSPDASASIVVPSCLRGVTISTPWLGLLLKRCPSGCSGSPTTSSALAPRNSVDALLDISFSGTWQPPSNPLELLKRAPKSNPHSSTTQPVWFCASLTPRSGHHFSQHPVQVSTPENRTLENCCDLAASPTTFKSALTSSSPNLLSSHPNYQSTNHRTKSTSTEPVNQPTIQQEPCPHSVTSSSDGGSSPSIFCSF